MVETENHQELLALLASKEAKHMAFAVFQHVVLDFESEV